MHQEEGTDIEYVVDILKWSDRLMTGLFNILTKEQLERQTNKNADRRTKINNVSFASGTVLIRESEDLQRAIEEFNMSLKVDLKMNMNCNGQLEKQINRNSRLEHRQKCRHARDRQIDKQRRIDRQTWIIVFLVVPLLSSFSVNASKQS